MWKPIPSFEKFEMNSENKMIRSVKQKNVLEVKKGKVRLTDSKGERKFYDVSDIYFKTFPITAKTPASVAVPKAQKKAKKEITKKVYGKLTLQNAIDIRKSLSEGVKVKTLAEKYNIHVSSVYDIKNFVFKKEKGGK